MARVTVHGDEDALARGAAERFTAIVEAAIAERGAAVVSLTGGSTPRHLYSLLADASGPWRRSVDWQRIHLFWGDERHVGPHHADSNYGMAYEVLLRHVPVPAGQVHRMQGEIADARAAARDYEAALARGFAGAGRRDQTFDLMLLGLGEDAHIASIFPGSPLLDPSSPVGRVSAVWAEHLRAWRITLTPAAILDAHAFLVVVSGKGKAAAVHAALDAPLDVQRSPAQLLRRVDDRVEWMMDAAANGLRRGH